MAKTTMYRSTFCIVKRCDQFAKVADILCAQHHARLTPGMRQQISYWYMRALNDVEGAREQWSLVAGAAGRQALTGAHTPTTHGQLE